MIVTALQTDIVWNDIPHNLATAEQLIKDSAGADLYVLPEMFSTGFITQPDGNAEPEGGTTLQWMLRMAKETQAAITGSVAVQTSQGDYRNRMYFVKPDGTFAYYDKHHLFTYAGEHQHYTAGSEPVIVLWRGVRIMLQVCYDLRFPCFSRNNSKPSTLNSKLFRPSQSLAMSNSLNRDAFPMVEVDEQQAIAYLRTEALQLPTDTPKGYVLITYQGHPLGFVKNIGNRANNLYPAEWRIRKIS